MLFSGIVCLFIQDTIETSKVKKEHYLIRQDKTYCILYCLDLLNCILFLTSFVSILFRMLAVLLVLGSY